MADVKSVNDYGQMQEVQLVAEPQRFLHQLLARTAVYHFEVTRPSLHDIFVRIAKPTEVASQ
jgi:ABC-2 type transport system ATP-binding protein